MNDLMNNMPNSIWWNVFLIILVIGVLLDTYRIWSRIYRNAKRRKRQKAIRTERTRFTDDYKESGK